MPPSGSRNARRTACPVTDTRRPASVNSTASTRPDGVRRDTFTSSTRDTDEGPTCVSPGSVRRSIASRLSPEYSSRQRKRGENRQ
mgnify:CR=1 FL=1